MSHRVSLSFIRRHRHQSFRPFFFIPSEKKVNISYSIHVKEMLGYYTHSLICIFRAYAGALSNKKPPKKSSPYHNNNNIVHGHQQQDLLFSITQLQMDKTCLLSSLLSILIFCLYTSRHSLIARRRRRHVNCSGVFIITSALLSSSYI